MSFASRTRKRGPTRIAHVVNNLDIGGLERVVIDLVKSTDPGRYLSQVVCLGDGGTLKHEIEAGGYALEAFHKREGISWSLPFRIARHLRRDRIDIVHAHNSGPVLYGGLAARFAGARVVYTIHGPESLERDNPRWVRRMGLIDRVVAVSQDTQRVAVGAYGFARDKVYTIENGVSLAAFNGNLGDEKRQELEIKPDDIVIGIVARLTALKDHKTLLEAFEGLALQRSNVRLLIVGDGPMREELTRRADAMNARERVMFLGGRLDVAELMAAMDIFVLSSQTEGLSVTLVEAAAAGLPIVATDVGGNPEVVSHGETGLIVPPEAPDRLAEAIEWMCEHAAQALEMGRCGRQRVGERFSALAMANGYSAIYDNVMLHSRRP